MSKFQVMFSDDENTDVDYGTFDSFNSAYDACEEFALNAVAKMEDRADQYAYEGHFYDLNNYKYSVVFNERGCSLRRRDLLLYTDVILETWSVNQIL